MSGCTLIYINERVADMRCFSCGKGGQHVMALAGIGWVDIIGTPVRRGNGSERE
jgi:hypothetical protein